MVPLVEVTESGDHYYPLEKVVRLTPDKFNGRSLAATTVAAHEVGHAIQDQDNHPPLALRTRLRQGARPAPGIQSQYSWFKRSPPAHGLTLEKLTINGEPNMARLMFLS
jgi:Zn-dependent membrane protease YugP